MTGLRELPARSIAVSAEPSGPGQSPPDRSRRLPSPAALLAVLRRHWIFISVAAEAVLARIVAMAGFQPAVLFRLDSYDYLWGAVHLSPNVVNVSGYSVFLWLLKPLHSLVLVAALQHLPIQVITAPLIVAVVFGSMAALSFIRQHEPAELDWFAVAAFAIISAAFLLPPQFFYHFTAFLAPFLALAIALPVTRLLAATWPAATRPGSLSRLSAAVTGALIVTMAIVQTGKEGRIHTKLSGRTVNVVRQLIPPGACLVTDQVSFSIAFDRFTSTRPGCPLLIDTIATNYAMTPAPCTSGPGPTGLSQSRYMRPVCRGRRRRDAGPASSTSPPGT